MKLKKKGFTLVELIIVIAIIAILAGAIFVAIDPARRLHETRNARRQSDVSTILDAIKKHQADNGGAFYSEIAVLDEGAYYIIGTQTSGCDDECANQTAEDACVDLSGMGANYMAVVPVDPSIGTPQKTGYMLEVNSGALTVHACEPEGEGPGGTGSPLDINVTR